MKFFLDTADLDEIREAASLGILDGVTTNPTLIRKAGARDFHEHIYQICELVEGDVSAEVTATDYEGMLREARELARIHERVVVKIPLIAEGIRAIKTLTEEGIRTNCTLCFSPTQALVAAKAGATYISPFAGRLDDVSSDGMRVIEQVVKIYRNYGFKTQVLAASLRHPMHVLEAALMGADVATMPFGVMMQLLKHPLTDVGLERFLKDWEAYLQAKQGVQTA
ncbi:transaldolase [Rhodothermus marinus SG0.5JP17-172]|mgnify:FL=1|uniref:fructose-6-phosphate aldolase n=1 Tax=Rhodothermus marinus TaxID=29549 RepID=UPI000223D91D|nr:fructose-6-phosphate aldolase [Rhodothermus marinus]AEN72414.1 transaldolase [Rhodothermus marinus SG0.5JP17-172]MBO2492735.1 fructose-6-phosphate aldolase [Rhodothermus marinus]